jgi:hypothetical protein
MLPGGFGLRESRVGQVRQSKNDEISDGLTGVCVVNEREQIVQSDRRVCETRGEISSAMKVGSARDVPLIVSVKSFSYCE